tara:strand:- start:959 stop:1111 length:153 start_codon:yes stop_codon:yes gene_type:complete
MLVPLVPLSLVFVHGQQRPHEASDVLVELLEEWVRRGIEWGAEPSQLGWV